MRSQKIRGRKCNFFGKLATLKHRRSLDETIAKRMWIFPVFSALILQPWEMVYRQWFLSSPLDKFYCEQDIILWIWIRVMLIIIFIIVLAVLINNFVCLTHLHTYAPFCKAHVFVIVLLQKCCSSHQVSSLHLVMATRSSPRLALSTWKYRICIRTILAQSWPGNVKKASAKLMCVAHIYHVSGSVNLPSGTQSHSFKSKIIHFHLPSIKTLCEYSQFACLYSFIHIQK